MWKHDTVLGVRKEVDIDLGGDGDNARRVVVRIEG